MKAGPKIAIAGMSVISSIGDNLGVFSRVLYENTQHTLNTLFEARESDAADAVLQALWDAGVTSEAAIPVWVCGDLTKNSLAEHLAQNGYIVTCDAVCIDPDSWLAGSLL